MLDIDALLASLANTRKVFHSEADFQHALAWEIHKAYPDTEIRLEMNFRSNEEHRRYVDIWLPSKGIAIELKHLTRELSVNYDHEPFTLTTQNARDQRRYDFLHDVWRLEQTRSQDARCRVGYAVLLTNDPLYWQPPTNEDTVDAAFHIYEGRHVSAELTWSERASDGTKQGRESPIQLRGSYHLHWQDFSDFPDERYGQFRYLLVKVI